MSMSRFTAYISDSERDKLSALARKLNTSENYVMRMALRSALGMDVLVTDKTSETEKVEVS